MDERTLPPYIPVTLRIDLKVAPQLLNDQVALKALVADLIRQASEGEHVDQVVEDVRVQVQAGLDSLQAFEDLVVKGTGDPANPPRGILNQDEPLPRMGTWDVDT